MERFLKFYVYFGNLLFRVGSLGWRDFAQRRTAYTCKSLFRSVIQIAVSNSCWFVRFRANHHDFARADRGFFVKTSALRVLLTWLNVFISQVYAFDDQHLVFVVDRNDFTCHGFVFTTDDCDCIAVVNLHFSRRFLELVNRGVSVIFHQLSRLNGEMIGSSTRRWFVQSQVVN